MAELIREIHPHVGDLEKTYHEDIWLGHCLVADARGYMRVGASTYWAIVTCNNSSCPARKIINVQAIASQK